MGAGPRFRVLGPLEIADAVVRGPKQRTLVAVLLLRDGPMSTDELLAALWGDAPPDTAVGQLHTRMWRLRRSLGDVVVTHAGGYELAVGRDDLDATLFADGARRGRELLDTGRFGEAAAVLTGALALWRGPALPDLDGPALAAPLAELRERRLAALHDLGEAGLAQGRHHELVPELRAQVQEHPVREELRAQLMLALYRSGRQAEALEVYREGRRLLVDELGIEPGPTLHGLHERMLAGDVGLEHGALTVRPDAAPVVAQLPADLADFTGRGATVVEVAGHLTGPARPAPRVVAVSGPAGTGKTSLAVRVAHLVAPNYPHGQLFVDLRGVAEPLDPAFVLARFLRALGEDPRTLPDDLDERAALYRDRTAALRLLVVLDNAEGEAQLRPLLPAGPQCAVLVTSRRRLAALAG
ncbi:MAG TPA: transcriptional regulator, partial [Pseudonocardiaceae bacterium]